MKPLTAESVGRRLLGGGGGGGAASGCSASFGDRMLRRLKKPDDRRCVLAAAAVGSVTPGCCVEGAASLAGDVPGSLAGAPLINHHVLMQSLF
jgi:hypothetical protein